MNHTIIVKSKRVFDPPEPSDGLRILVDHFWPRGIKKSDLHLDLWAKDVVPSDELRRLFHADPDGNWPLFEMEYSRQLDDSAELANLADVIRDANPESVTLLYAFHNKVHNHAFILQQALQNILNR